MINQKNSRKSTPEREFILSNQNINDISFMSMENKNDSPYLDAPKATNKTPISLVLKRRRLLDKIFSDPKGNNKISMRNNRITQKKEDNKSWDMSFIDSSFSNKNTTINSNTIQNECNIKPRNVMKFINKPKLPLSFRTITNESSINKSNILHQQIKLNSNKPIKDNNKKAFSFYKFFPKNIQKAKKFNTISVDNIKNKNLKKKYELKSESNIKPIKRSNSIDINKVKCEDNSLLYVYSFIKKVNPEQKESSEKIAFLSMPRMVTLLSPNKKDKRIIFMLTPSCAFSNFGIENYEIRFIHPDTRRIILSFNILSIQLCERIKNNNQIVKLTYNESSQELNNICLFTNSENEAKNIVKYLNDTVNICKCKAFSATEKFGVIHK